MSFPIVLYHRVIAAERHQRILGMVERDRSVSIASLRRNFPVSLMTLWRDLEHLREAGRIQRVRGGAVAAGDPAETAISVKARRHSEAKRRIARTAVDQLVRRGMTLIIDGGSTVAEVCPLLAGRGVTVLTHSLTILARMQRDAPDAGCHASGGMLRPISGTFVGPDAIRFFRRKRADLFLMTVTGLDPEHGLTDPNPLEVEVKQAMIQAAQRTVLLVDASKLGQTAMCPVAPFHRMHAVVCDAPNQLPRFPARPGARWFRAR
ncbi:MAG: DeoR/GlpR transcriptional regulator [Verrucomicrobia bacterium]|nr:DeoR/GlpR transcriptional regulator [Verrucomicrobiota bacterium]NBS78493.1 DeoR/GlpR transcriptional regulator [bacterium]NBS49531.1 DeoR/GlpR transcriptional regulator [Verrucomicrobiota bacterium]NBT23683.1 DeoR/GlpR transcriptional regulator [bacterium]NBV96070.1 DeoR/GlpR transcriptional regulator [Verrucomicrobiota bacterium]